jgi:4-alpha-glucanotransferase
MTILDRLADYSFIEAEFRDARGELHRTTPATQRALLSAMGVLATNDTEAAAALAELERAEWVRPLPPVRVAYADHGPITVDLTLPAGAGWIGWHILLEDGGELAGEVAFGSLKLTALQDLDGRVFHRRTLELGAALPVGYHRLTVPCCEAETALIVTPGRCWLPPSLGKADRLWGISAQLYLLRSAANWGIGDFGDLRRLAALLSDHGADIIGLNPLHAMFPDQPEHASPYSPASRLLLNILNIDVDQVCEQVGSDAARAMMESADFRRRLAACRAAPLVDYTEVADLKLRVLRALFAASSTTADSDAWSRFQQFRHERAALLEPSCLFLALREHFAGADWHLWPADYQHPTSEAVRRFAAEHADRVTFHVWLQWLADLQLAEAAAAADGMAVGLYRDLAVGADRTGAETWANQLAVVSGAQVGAPPDIHNPAGQDWGLPPFHPRALREEAYHSFIQLVQRFHGTTRITRPPQSCTSRCA